MFEPPITGTSKQYYSQSYVNLQADLPYIVAAIQEGQRHVRSGSFNVPHLSTRDFTLGGFFIPKDTQVFVNHGAIKRNSDYYEVRQKFPLNSVTE